MNMILVLQQNFFWRLVVIEWDVKISENLRFCPETIRLSLCVMNAIRKKQRLSAPNACTRTEDFCAMTARQSMHAEKKYGFLCAIPQEWVSALMKEAIFFPISLCRIMRCKMQHRMMLKTFVVYAHE